MRLRVALWGVFLVLQCLAIAFHPEAIAPVVAGSIYVPLLVFRELGLPVLAAAESGGWSAPSILGWSVVAAFWAVLWWGVASFISPLLRRAFNRV